MENLKTQCMLLVGARNKIAQGVLLSSTQWNDGVSTGELVKYMAIFLFEEEIRQSICKDVSLVDMMIRDRCFNLKYCSQFTKQTA